MATRQISLTDVKVNGMNLAQVTNVPETIRNESGVEVPNPEYGKWVLWLRYSLVDANGKVWQSGDLRHPVPLRWDINGLVADAVAAVKVQEEMTEP